MVTLNTTTPQVTLDARTLFKSLDSDPLKFMSFSGADIQCFFFGEDLDPVIEDIDAASSLTQAEKTILKQKLNKKNVAILPFAELQTLTISSTRSCGPIRRLGEIEPIQYKKGARTIAGTMIFAMLSRDIFTQYMDRIIPGVQNNSWTGPDFVDQIPPFNILINMSNESGRAASGILIGVEIVNFGTTFSIDDMYTESTYSYVAKHYTPVVDDPETTLKNFNNLTRYVGPKPLSQMLLEEAKLLETQNKARRVSREFFDFLSKLPNRIRDKMSSHYEDLYDAWKEIDSINRARSNGYRSNRPGAQGVVFPE